MRHKSTSQIILEQEIAKVEEELASAFAVRPPSIARRVELDVILERLKQKMESERPTQTGIGATAIRSGGSIIHRTE